MDDISLKYSQICHLRGFFFIIRPLVPRHIFHVHKIFFSDFIKNNFYAFAVLFVSFSIPIIPSWFFSWYPQTLQVPRNTLHFISTKAQKTRYFRHNKLYLIKKKRGDQYWKWSSAHLNLIQLILFQVFNLHTFSCNLK